MIFQNCSRSVRARIDFQRGAGRTCIMFTVRPPTLDLPQFTRISQQARVLWDFYSARPRINSALWGSIKVRNAPAPVCVCMCIDLLCTWARLFSAVYNFTSGDSLLGARSLRNKGYFREGDWYYLEDGGASMLIIISSYNGGLKRYDLLHFKSRYNSCFRAAKHQSIPSGGSKNVLSRLNIHARSVRDGAFLPTDSRWDVLMCRAEIGRSCFHPTISLPLSRPRLIGRGWTPLEGTSTQRVLLHCITIVIVPL